jgi:predicted DNA-binding transcriptional regulator
MTMIEKLLEIGFTKTEAEIYLALLEHSRLTPASISRITGINRTTVYAAAAELVKRSVVIEDLSGKTKYLVALEPTSLLGEVEKESRKIRRQEQTVKSLIPELDLLPKSNNYSIPKIQFVEGKDIEDFLYKKTPIWEQSVKDKGGTTWWGFQDHSFVEDKRYLDWILWYWKRAPSYMDLKLFTNQSDIEEEMAKKQIEKRQMRLWKGENFTSTQWILGEYIVSIVTEGKLHYLVQIRDSVLAESMRNFVKHSWNSYDQV